ncbi:hypothetical protein [Spirosoma linguale]
MNETTNVMSDQTGVLVEAKQASGEIILDPRFNKPILNRQPETKLV